MIKKYNSQNKKDVLKEKQNIEVMNTILTEIFYYFPEVHLKLIQFNKASILIPTAILIEIKHVASNHRFYD